MKKLSIVIIMLLGFSLFVNAQDEELKSKKGVPILPESGDYALGVNAVPFFEYVGNTFNGNAFNTVGFNFVNNQAIMGKYFLDDATAIRGMVRIGYLNQMDREFVVKSADVPDPDDLVEDLQKDANTTITIGVGLEKRRGKGRVQGFYGGQLGLLYNTTSEKYDYGNPITADYPSPDWTNAWGNTGNNGGRITERNNVVAIGAQLRGFVGVEYFFAPKVSVGGEFGWGVGYTQIAGGEETEEYWTGTELETKTTDVAKDANFGLDTDNLNAALFLLFHF